MQKFLLVYCYIRLTVKIEKKISQVAFNQKLFFAAKKETYNFCFRSYVKVTEPGSTQSRCSYDGHDRHDRQSEWKKMYN